MHSIIATVLALVPLALGYRVYGNETTVTVRETTTVALPESTVTLRPVQSTFVRRVSTLLNPRPLTKAIMTAPYPPEPAYVPPEGDDDEFIMPVYQQATASERRPHTGSKAFTYTVSGSIATRTVGKQTTHDDVASSTTTEAAATLTEPTTTALPQRESSTLAVHAQSPLAATAAAPEAEQPLDDDGLACEEDPLLAGSGPSLIGRRRGGLAGKYNATACTTRSPRAVGTVGHHRHPAMGIAGGKPRPSTSALEEGRAAGLVAGTGALAAVAVFLVLLL